MDNKLFNILNQLQNNIYITDPETNEIVFINDKMKEQFRLHDVIGKPCWKVFQKNMNSRCPFCKVPTLLASKNNRLIKWHETSETLNEIFENYDSLIEIDGKIYHMQEAKEIGKEIVLQEKATYDDLSGIFNHSTGKEKLYQLITHPHPDFSVILLNIDHMRKINEIFSRQIGDKVLKTCATTLFSSLKEDEFIYRYSGDEFILVLFRPVNEIHVLLHNTRKEMHQICEQNKLPLYFSFTYGLVEIKQETTYDFHQLMTLIDENMYIEKLKRYRTESLEKKDEVLAVKKSFDDYFDPTINRLFDSLTTSTDDFIYISNLDAGYFRYSPAQVEYFKLPSEIMYNVLDFWKERVHPEDWDKFYLSNMQIIDNKTNYHSIEFRAKNANDQYVWLKCRGHVLEKTQKGDRLFAGIITVMGRQNSIDALTQIPNQIHFSETIHYKINTTKNSFYIMLVDIDDFKTLNELYHRDFGDQILKSVAHLFQKVLPDTAQLFRLEKDVFAIIYENASSKQVNKLYNDLSTILIKSYIEKQISINLSISAGCVCYPNHCHTSELLRKYCETALHHAKEKGKNQLCEFNSSLLTNREEKLALVKQLNDSILNNFDTFFLYYQPQVDVNKKMITGVEALLRWKDENGQIVSPMTFIPLLEEYDMIQIVTIWVLKKAIMDIKKWLTLYPSFTVSVNISVLHILEDDFFQSILNVLNEVDFPIQNIILEITESTTSKNIHLLSERLNHLRAVGFKIALDDFGTEYSSLNILKTAPFDIVKIDKAFVRNVEDDEYNRTFIQFVTSIAHHAHLKVYLEGIETTEELRAVLPLCLDYIQGYLFGKPMPLEEIQTLMNKQLF